MATKKSIDGLSPKQRKNTASSLNADGFTPLMQPRKTTRGKTTSSRNSSTSSRTIHSTKSLAEPDLIHPEEFIPPRKTTKKSNLKTPKISNPAPKTVSKTTSKTAAKKTTSTSKKTASHIEAVNENFLEPIRAFDFDEETGELMTAEEPTEKPLPKKAQKTPKPQKTKKKWSKKRKFWTWFAIILVGLLLIGGIIFVIWGNDIIARITGGRGNIMDLFTENYEPLKEDQYGRTNILAFGTSGFDMSGTEYGGGVHDGADLTDSIMIISFNQDTGDADLISLPRDLKVDAGCNYTGKINEVYYCNNLDGDNEEGGADALAKEVSDVLGIDLPYFVHVNWGSLKEIVDDLGGVTVTLDEPVNDYEYTGAVYEAGVPYTLSGQDAIALARARHGTANGDFTRGASQQKILIGIKDKVLQDGLSVSDLVKLANTLGDNLRTNFSVGEIKSLAHLATTIDWEHITEASFLEPEPLLTDGMINGISYVYPSAGVTDFSEIRAYIKKLLSTNTNSETSNSADPASENASILILNNTGQAGLASSEQAVLEATGLENISIDDLTDVTFSAPYTLYSFTTAAPATQSALESHYGITTSPNPPTYLPTGYDFILIIGG